MRPQVAKVRAHQGLQGFVSLLENPNVVIGKSKFAELRPPQVCLCSETPRNVCLCRYHENTSLLLECVRRHVQLNLSAPWCAALMTHSVC